MSQTFYSNGKLLLTGEYAILGGATGLALPTKYGQSLTIKECASDTLVWNSVDEQHTTWFTATFTKTTLTVRSTSDTDIAKRLSEILHATQKLCPSFLSGSTGYKVETKLSFNRNWGLGSSSTLIANISRWAKALNPYELLAHTFGGSGYDLACATHNNPILFSPNNYKPRIKEVTFNPAFKDQLYFIYLNQKKNSREAIEAYRNARLDKEALNAEINKLTMGILESKELSDFEYLISEHEQLLSKTLGVPTIKKQLFADYPKGIKSLGAWGGDFIMATGNSTDMNYFKTKGYHTIIPFSMMILQPES